MRRPRLLVTLLAGLALVGCGGVGTTVTELADGADELVDPTRFCLSLARTLSAVDEGVAGPAAVEAAEVALTHAPDDVRDDARTLAERIRGAHGAGGAVTRDEALTELVERLREQSRGLCDGAD